MVNLKAFKDDLVAYSSTPWLRGNRLKGFLAFAIDRWNDYSSLKLGPTLTVEFRRGSRHIVVPVRLGTDDFDAFREVFVFGAYDCDVGQPKTILDLGGYGGYASMTFAARFPEARIAAVEPHPDNFARMTANFERNSLPVTAIHAAATAVDGPITLYINECGMRHTLTPQHGRPSIHVDGLSVPTILQRLGWPRIDLLKIDIEGAEQALFSSGQPWLSDVQSIIGEYHPPYGLDDVRNDLAPHRFDVSAAPYPFIFLARRR